MKSPTRKVLFISHDASRTGASIFLLRFLQWFRQNREIPFRILVGRHGDLVHDFESLAPVDLFEPEPTVAYKILRRLRLNGRHRSKHLSALREGLLHSDIGLIYSNTIVNGEILDFLSFLKCPVICHVHELEGLVQSFGARNMGLVEEHASTYIAVSNAVETNLVANHGIQQEKIRVIHGFIPIHGYGEQKPFDSRGTVCRELGISTSSKLVFACGSVEHRKGTDLFLEVARQLQKMNMETPVHFVWVGGRPDQVLAMRKEIDKMALQESVHFIGPRSDVNPYYAAADVFLLPSREDPFPLVMLEAALRGKPIVCFDKSGGAPEFVGNDAGILVPGFDVTKMAQKVAMLLSSPEVSGRLGETGKQRVLAHHDLKVGAVKIARIIEDQMMLPQHRQKTHPAETEHSTV